MSLSESDIEPLVTFPPGLYDDWLTEKLGAFQEANRANNSAAVCIDFSDCEFASPIPVLAVATELMTNSTANRKIIIDLGAGGMGPIALNKARTRKFLALHGFLNCFVSNRKLNVSFQFDPQAETGSQRYWSGKDQVSGQDLRQLRAILEGSPVDLIYGASVVVTATTWRVPDATISPAVRADKVRSKVADLLWGADQALFKFRTEARKYRDTALHRLTQILLELVENTAEHAYLGSESGYVGLYARVRNRSASDVSKWRSEELSCSPLLNRLLRPDGLHQIEVFVVDVGRGLLADVGSWEGCASIVEATYPLRAVASKLFLGPLSRHSRSEASVSNLRGNSTGFMHLNAILEKLADTSRIFTSNEGIAGSHPRSLNPDATAGTTGDFHLGSAAWQGSIFHIGLKPTEIPTLPNPWFESDDENSAPIRKEVLRRVGNLECLAAPEVVDIRYGTSTKALQKAVERVSNVGERTVVRLGRVAQKNYINNLVSSWCDSFLIAGADTALLYLCDLSRSQAIDTAWIISQYFPMMIKVANDKLRAAIFVVTEDLCCVQLRISFAFKDKKTAEATVMIREVPVSRLPDGLAYVVASLRRHDSAMLWQRINQLNQESVNQVLIRNVLWTSASLPAKVLPWYLDFAALVQDREAARLVRRGLRRILALFPDANDQSLDPIVEASLHDAKKWLVRPKDARKEQVLVGSLSVSGSTLSRHRAPPGVTVVGILDCIQTPYHLPDPKALPLHLAALLWDSRLEVETTDSAIYKRIGSTAHIESATEQPKCYKLDSDLYGALGAYPLAKVGHWEYGDRHSLIDINAGLVIEQSSATDTGVVEWLRERLVEFLKDGPVCLSFPFSRLAYRLAHTAHAKLAENLKPNIKLLAVSFLPRFAGGLTPFVPLTTRAAKQIKETWPGVVPVAVFLDIGFVTSRTLRHTVRQLRECGFETVHALGLLNRSSAPILSTELDAKDYSDDAVPKAYWRWNLPIFGTGTHCALCAALPHLASVRQAIVSSHIDLEQYVDSVVDQWRPHDVEDFWDEHGLNSETLKPEVISCLKPFFEELTNVYPTSSTTLTAQVIELLRLSGDTSHPLRVANKLMSVDAESCVELISCVLLLAASGLGQRDHEDYIRILLDSLIACDDQINGSSASDRRSRLIGLATLALAIQKTNCRLVVMNELVQNLSNRLIHSPNVRVALIAFTIDADGKSGVQSAFDALCISDKANKTLISNYHALRCGRANVPETWHKLESVFGRSASHGQQSMAGRLLAQFRDGCNRQVALSQIDSILSLLGQCHVDFVRKSFDYDLQQIVCGLFKIKELLADSSQTNLQIRDQLSEVLRVPSFCMHKVLQRVGHGTPAQESPLARMAFEARIADIANSQGFSTADDIVVAHGCRTMTWPQDNKAYLPLCREFDRLLVDIFENIKKIDYRCPPPDESLFGVSRKEARLWWWIETKSIREGCTLVFLNGFDDEQSLRPYKPTLGYLRESQFDVTAGPKINSVGQKYFEIRVSIPSLDRILKEIK